MEPCRPAGGEHFHDEIFLKRFYTNKIYEQKVLTCFIKKKHVLGFTLKYSLK